MAKKKGIDISEIVGVPFTPSEIGGVIKILKGKISKAKRLEQLERSALQRMEEAAKKYPKDIGSLWKSYQKLKTQKWSKKFLEGYYSAISDLIYIKKKL